MFKIPGQNKKYSITNKSDVGGNIYYTKNIDFNTDGYLKLADAAISVYDGSSDVEYDTAQAINTGDGSIYVLSDDTFNSFSIDLITSLSNRTTAEGAPTPGVEEDVTFYNNNWVISDDGVFYDNSGAWTSISGTPATSGNPNVLERFPYQNALLVGNGNQVALVNTSWTVVTTLTLPQGYKVVSMDTVGSYAYIGTATETGDSGALFRWDGSSTSHNGIYEVDSYEISSVKRYGSSVVCVTAWGQLLYFNGSSFTELAQFPFYTDREEFSNNYGNEYQPFTHRGMVVDGDRIYLSLGGTLSTESLTKNNLPNGIWCYTPNAGLHHIFSGTRTNFGQLLVGASNVNTSTNIFTKTSGIDIPETGTRIFINQDFSMGVNGEVRDNRWYYIIKLSSTTFQIARTYKDAIDSVALDITAAPTFTLTFESPQYNGYGDTYLEDRIGLALYTENGSRGREKIGRLVYAVSVQNDTGTLEYHLCTSQPYVKNHGYFVTPKLYSSEGEDVFNRITLKYKELTQDDEIVVKYKNIDKSYLPSQFETFDPSFTDVTWTNQTTFTTKLDLQDAVVGDEVEIISGAGAGITSHISSISRSDETYTVTLEDTIDLITASDTSKVYVDNFKKLGTITKDHPERYKSFTLNKKSEWIQVKVELKGRGITIEELIVDNKTDKPI